MAGICDELAELLSAVQRPGDFFAGGRIEAFASRIEVEGVGPIALPLLDAQGKQLIAVAKRAPYGRGRETIVDTKVRRTWQIAPDHVRIGGKHWKATLDRIVALTTEGLGVAEPVEVELYKLLIYDKGSFFVPHRDTEKAPGMFATLVLALPSQSAGGELVVRHKGREAKLDLTCDEPSEISFAAFYADCVHEVLPVNQGFRATLVFNLVRKSRGPAPEPPSYEGETARTATLLKDWASREASPNDDSPEKVIYPLEHAYTPGELDFAKLKGADAAAAALLKAAVPLADCELHLALVSMGESGSAEYNGSYRRRYRGWEDDDDSDEFEVVEVLDEWRHLAEWRRPDGTPTALGTIPIEDGEISPSDALQDMEPDEEHFREATGNEGASFERTYKRAALVLWPRARQPAVINQAGAGATLPYLETLASRWIDEGRKHTSPTWIEAHTLSGLIIATWQERQWVNVRDNDMFDTDASG